MGSDSDLVCVQKTLDLLRELGISCELRVCSAHRTPRAAHDYAAGAEERGLKVIIAAAGMAAHLAGVMASLTSLPVIGIPIASGPLNGLDALLATVQMPGGIPVATFAIGKAGAKNAGLFAGAIIARSDEAVREKLVKFREAQSAAVPERPY